MFASLLSIHADSAPWEVRRVPLLFDVRVCAFPADSTVLRGHPGLEWIRIAPMWSPKITDATIEHLAHIPNMKRISLNEGYVTWENGLRHLLRLKRTFEELRLEKSVIDPADPERFRREMPDVNVKVEHAGLAVVGELIRTNFKGAGRKLPKWVPQELLERYVAAAEAASSAADEAGNVNESTR